MLTLALNCFANSNSDPQTLIKALELANNDDQDVNNHKLQET